MQIPRRHLLFMTALVASTTANAACAGATAPIPPGVLYENMSTPSSDHHMMVVQQGSCRLFELYAWDPSSATTGWSVLVTWNLTDDEQLPDGWGSTTAAGTPLLPGVIWYDEVSAGKIEHAVDIVIPAPPSPSTSTSSPRRGAAGPAARPIRRTGSPTEAGSASRRVTTPCTPPRAHVAAARRPRCRRGCAARQSLTYSPDGTPARPRRKGHLSARSDLAAELHQRRAREGTAHRAHGAGRPHRGARAAPL